MAYDSVRHKVVLFGGNSSSTTLNDTWEYDGTNWTQVATTGPGAREYFAMVYDPVGQRTLLYGGLNGSELGDMWAWNGTTWTQLMITTPPARGWPGMVYDSTRQVVVMFGGSVASTAKNDTWEFNVSTNVWTQRTSAGSPLARFVWSMIAYDPTRQRVVQFGGFDSSVSGGSNQTQEYNGSTWTTISTSGTPQALWASTMAFDPLNNTVFLVDGALSGGVVNSTTYSYASPAYTSGTSPTSRGWHMMTYDSFRNRMVVFGGYDGNSSTNDTWEY
ncbi:MAG: kelch repeat-containing protein [Myxococcaceae bacterium]